MVANIDKPLKTNYTNYSSTTTSEDLFDVFFEKNEISVISMHFRTTNAHLSPFNWLIRRLLTYKRALILT